MKFTIDKAEAKRVLDLVSKCVPQRAVLPILQTIFITVEEDGKAKFCATNLETYVTAFAKVQTEIPGSCCIDSMLTSLISNFDDGDVKFTEGKGKVTVTQKNRRHQIGCMPAEEFPMGRELTGYQKLDVQEFVRAMSVASIAASTDTSRPVLQGCSIDSKRGFVAGADGYRLAKYDAIFPGDSVIIPAKAISGFILNELKSVQGEEAEAVFGQWSGIRCSKWDIVLNSLEGEFPDVGPFISDAQNEESVLEIDIDKVELRRKLNICGLYLVRGGVPFVKLTRKEKNLYLSVHAPDVGDVREDFSDYTCVGDDFSIWFNPNYLLAAIGTVNSDMVHMKFVSPAKPFFITDANVPAMLHVLMPGSGSRLGGDTDDMEEEEGDF